METPLSEQERREILDKIHQREILERQALTEEQQAKRAEAEFQSRLALAEAARRAEEERKQRLLDNLSNTRKLVNEALEALQEGDERQCYRLLVKADPIFNSVKHQLNQSPERPSGGSVPTVRVKANNPLGYMLINSEDVRPDHEILEDANGY